jgi:hypothetical protein
MTTWRPVPAIDGDDERLVSRAFVGAATVRINRARPSVGHVWLSPDVVIVPSRARPT